jgi:diguanylate cyclase (GGDEF)-like protein
MHRRSPEALKSAAGSPALDLPKTRTGFHHFEDVKDLLIVEVRRAKRYGYPLSVLLVRLDPIPAFQQLQRPGLPREITAGLAAAIARAVRVIDLPIHYADDSIMVFLPHTDQEGAEEVGRRIKRRIKRITYRDDQIRCQLTASVGVAGISAGDNLTFSKLIRNATAALRAAQLKGGDKVMKKVSSPRLPTGRTGPFLPATHGLRARLESQSGEDGLIQVESDPGESSVDEIPTTPPPSSDDSSN